MFQCRKGECKVNVGALAQLLQNSELRKCKDYVVGKTLQNLDKAGSNRWQECDESNVLWKQLC